MEIELIFLLTPTIKLLIPSADLQSLPVGIIVFAHVVRPSVRPTFQNKTKKTMFATGETVGLADWISDDTCFVNPFHLLEDGCLRCKHRDEW